MKLTSWLKQQQQQHNNNNNSKQTNKLVKHINEDVQSGIAVFQSS